jgi:hypothetical protein
LPLYVENNATGVGSDHQRCLKMRHTPHVSALPADLASMVSGLWQS